MLDVWGSLQEQDYQQISIVTAGFIAGSDVVLQDFSSALRGCYVNGASLIFLRHLQHLIICEDMVLTLCNVLAVRIQSLSIFKVLTSSSHIDSHRIQAAGDGRNKQFTEIMVNMLMHGCLNPAKCVV